MDILGVDRCSTLSRVTGRVFSYIAATLAIRELDMPMIISVFVWLVTTVPCRCIDTGQRFQWLQELNCGPGLIPLLVQFHPPISHQFIFADKYKQVNIKVHLQGEWKKRGDPLLSPLTHSILLHF